MNRSKIEWTQWTWNPITGCTRICRDEKGRIYCYAYYMAQRLRGRSGYSNFMPFFPTYHRNRLDEPYNKKPAKIFTCSMGDIFDPHVEEDWIEDVFNVMKDCFNHTFQILTKRYYRLLQFNYPENLWLGVSQDGVGTDTDAILALQLTDAKTKFISFEPLNERIDLDFEKYFRDIDWIIIGSQTGRYAAQPDTEWVELLLEGARVYDIPVFMKNNLEWEDKRQEFPKEKTPFLQTLVEG